MKVTITIADNIIKADIFGDIDHHSAKEIREKIDAALTSSTPTALVMDFGNVSFMDSSGIGLVMGRYRLAKEMGATTKIVRLNYSFKRVMKLAGLDKLVAMDDDKEVKKNESDK